MVHVLRMWQKIWDRRGVPREEVKIPVRLWVVDALGRGRLTVEHSVLAVNLSEGGCCLSLPTLALEGFHLQRCLNSGEDYLLEMEMLLPRGGQWRLYGEVTWTNRAWEQEPSAFLAGVRFVGPVSLPGNWRRLVEVKAGV